MARPFIDTERVAQIRSRFNEAKRYGHSDEVASAYANGSGPMPSPPPKPKPFVPPPAPTKLEDTAGNQREDDEGRSEFIQEEDDAGGAGGQTAVVATIGNTGTPATHPNDKIDIPADWKDGLPWPELRKLAASLTEEKVINRDDCERVINAELRRRADYAAAAELAQQGQ